MAKIDRLNGCIDWIDLDSVERQRTPERAMKHRYSVAVSGALAVEYRLNS
jgi:putative transposase